MVFHQQWPLRGTGARAERKPTRFRSIPHGPLGGQVAMRTTRERAEQKRQEKLELVRQQVQSGTLVVRQMTAEERRRYPPRPAPPDRPRGR